MPIPDILYYRKVVCFLFRVDNDLKGNYKKLISKEWIKCLVQYLAECYLRIRSCRVLFYSLKCL